MSQQLVCFPVPVTRASSKPKQKVINSWKYLTFTDSVSKPPKVETPNKLDMTCQEKFFAEEMRLGNLLGEYDLCYGLLFLYYTQTQKTTLHFSHTQLESKFSLAAILTRDSLGKQQILQRNSSSSLLQEKSTRQDTRVDALLFKRHQRIRSSILFCRSRYNLQKGNNKTRNTLARAA